MTSEQIIDILTTSQKIYAGIMPQGTFSSIVTRIKNGTCKPKTKEWFFTKFGYSLIIKEEHWEKK